MPPVSSAMPENQSALESNQVIAAIPISPIPVMASPMMSPRLHKVRIGPPSLSDQ